MLTKDQTLFDFFTGAPISHNEKWGVIISPRAQGYAVIKHCCSSQICSIVIIVDITVDSTQATNISVKSSIMCLV